MQFSTYLTLFVSLLLSSSLVSAAAVLNANWQFDEFEWFGNAGEVIDSGPNSYHGTSNTPLLNSQDGVVCNAADFTALGTSDYVTLDNDALDGLGDFSISIWGKLSDFQHAQTLISGANSSWNNSALLYFIDSDQVDIYFRSNSRLGSFDVPDIDDGEWHHFVWTRDGRDHCFYVDGDNVGCFTRGDFGDTDIDPNGLIIGQEQDQVGGRFSSSQAWDGLLDELIIFRSELTSFEVRSIYNNQKAGRDWNNSSTARTCPEPPTTNLPAPRAEWHLDEPTWLGAQDEIKDSSGNNFHGYASQAFVTTTDSVVCRAVDLNGDIVSNCIPI